MSKKNAKKQRLDEERHTGLSEPNPLLYTVLPRDHFLHYLAPGLTLPGKPPHRICRGRP